MNPMVFALNGSALQFINQACTSTPIYHTFLHALFQNKVFSHLKMTQTHRDACQAAKMTQIQ